MSKVETITIDTPSGSNTMQIGSTNTATINLGVSGDTVNIPSGVTIANAGTATGFGITGWSNNGSNNDLLAANASAGIYLGVNSATAANLLDYYEEGSWTPIVTTGGANPSYTTQHGRYVRVGNICTVYMKLEYTSSSGNTGQWGGLPFNASNEQSGAMDQYISIYDGRNTTVYQALLIANDNKFYLRANGTLSGGLQTPSDFSGTRFYMQGSYITA
jgi:hypothetical protein